MAGKRLGWTMWKQAFEVTGRRKPYLHLERANTKGVCFCECERGLAAVPDQLDCPWCGCGWLLTCACCGKAFTYGKPVLISRPLDELVMWDMSGRGYKEKDATEVAKSATPWMRDLLRGVEERKEYVYFDGHIAALDSKDLTVEGFYANHKLRQLPHAAELRKPGSLDVLSDPEYWLERARPGRDD